MLMLPEPILKISFNAKIQKTWQIFFFLLKSTKASIGWLRQSILTCWTRRRTPTGTKLHMAQQKQHTEDDDKQSCSATHNSHNKE